MHTFSTTLSDAEYQAFRFVAASPEDWADNAIRDRARIAIDEIVQIVVAKCFETSTPIPGTKDEIVALGYAQGWIVAAADRPSPVSPVEVTDVA